MPKRALAHRRQIGQALVLVLLLAGASGLALVMLYNASQMVAARARLTHAADAAAYSGALVQARALNFLAYINRAQIGHQVAMAHLVTLASWAQFGNTQSRQAGRGNPPAGLIGMLFGAAAGQAYASARGSEAAVRQLEQSYAEHDRIVQQVLQHAAMAVRHSQIAQRDAAMLSVLRANFPESKSSGWADAQPSADAQAPGLRLSLLSDSAPGYVRVHRGNGAGGFRSLLIGAVQPYPFLDERKGLRRNAWPVSKRCPWLRHELRRRGGTWLDQDGNWGSMDTLSFHALRSNRWIGCYYREYAMGWGLAQEQAAVPLTDIDYAQDPPANFSSQDFWRWVQQSTEWNIFSGSSNPLANSYAVAGAARWASSGLPAYHEIPLGNLAQPLRFAIALRQSADALPTTDAASRLSAPRGWFAYAGLAQGQALRVVSAAETYFSRPQARSDGRRELASLFRPYWQARRTALWPNELALAGRAP